MEYRNNDVINKEIDLPCTKLIPSVTSGFNLLRLIEQYQKQNQIIIAYDFDDTVKPLYSSDCSEIQSLLRGAKRALNAYFIVYTSNSQTDEIKRFLDEENIPYDSVNENAPFVPFKFGKLFYNILLDDKAGLAQAASDLKALIYLVDNGFLKQPINKLRKEEFNYEIFETYYRTINVNHNCIFVYDPQFCLHTKANRRSCKGRD